MKSFNVLFLFSVLAVLLGQNAGAQSPAGPTAPAQQQNAQSNSLPPTSSPQDQPGETQPARPPQPPVLRGTNRDLIDRKTSSQDASPDDVGEGDVVRVDTTLISIPVSVMDRDGKYIPNLRQKDFRIWEDGSEQQVAYFASTEKPFTVVLMIDTSGSTVLKLERIQDAAIAFVEQLRAHDLVMVVSFSDKIKVLSRPTNDRAVLRSAIRQTRGGSGTRLFDAMHQVVNKELNGLEGRIAVILFTDGVDTTSKRATYYQTVREVVELGALVYPIKYDTYSDLDIIDPDMGGRQNSSGSGNSGAGTSRLEYERGDRYLQDLARVSGARVYNAKEQNLAQAFRLVAEELRRQYSVGYYPKKVPQPGDSRQIKVRVNQPELVVRTRDSYVFRPRTKASTDSVNSQSKPRSFNQE